MRSDNSALSTVQDALGLGAATVDIAYTGVNSAIKVVDQIKSKLVAARQPGVDRAKIQSEITELQSQLRGIANSASFSGENWLSVDSGDPGYNATKTIVSSFSRSGGVVTIGTISIDLEDHQAVRRQRPVGHSRHPEHDDQRRRDLFGRRLTDAVNISA